MRITCIAAVPALVFCSALTAVETQNPGWELLKTLAGEWQGTMEGQPGTAKVTYRVVSNGSVLMETMVVPEHTMEMITMYHPDGDGLVVTHYCAVGNQPRMRSGAVAPGARKIAFRFESVTNLASPDAAHMRELTVTSVDHDHLVQEWTHREKGQESTAVFRYTRVK